MSPNFCSYLSSGKSFSSSSPSDVSPKGVAIFNEEIHRASPQPLLS